MSNASGYISKQSCIEKKKFIYIESSFSSRIHNAPTPPNTPFYLNNCYTDLFEAKLMACCINFQQEEKVLFAI